MLHTTLDGIAVLILASPIPSKKSQHQFGVSSVGISMQHLPPAFLLVQRGWCANFCCKALQSHIIGVMQAVYSVTLLAGMLFDTPYSYWSLKK